MFHQPRPQCRTSACPAEAPVCSAFLPEPSWTPWSAFPPLPGAARSPNALLRTDQTVLRPRAAGCPPELVHRPLHVQTGLESLGAQCPPSSSAFCSMSLSCWVLPVFRSFLLQSLPRLLTPAGRQCRHLCPLCCESRGSQGQRVWNKTWDGGHDHQMAASRSAPVLVRVLTAAPGVTSAAL